jgi:predicted  nucleic acid-binding Zn-ribbon protein
MSTAGKVLVVLVALVTVAWIILAAGVAQLNANGTKRLHELTQEVAKTEAKIADVQHDVVVLRGQIASAQEKVDIDLAVLRTRLIDVEKAHSQILEGLARSQYELATVEETIKAAQTNLEHRNEEKAAEEKGLADARTEVRQLMDDSTRLMKQLKSLRETFLSTHTSNVGMVSGKSR